MPRRNIADLPFPGDGYRIDLRDPPRGKHGFEPEADTIKEDALRAFLCASARADLAGPSTRELNRLIKQLNSVRFGRRPRTLASSTYMRRLRRRIIGALWRFAKRYRQLGVTVATIIPRGWEIPAGELHTIDVDKLFAAFRSELYRAGAKKASGGLIAFLHGEHEPSRNVYQLHLHALVVGGMIEVVDDLRKRRNYRLRRSKPGQSPDPVRTRVQIKRDRLTNLPYALSYIFKSFWVSRAAYVGKDGKPRRVRHGRRILGPQHLEVLQFLNRHKPGDLCLLVHVQVTKQGFELTTSATEEEVVR